MTRKTKKQILAEAGYVPKMGRPALADRTVVLDRIVIPAPLADALGKQAKTDCLTIPQARRRAYKIYTQRGG